MSEYAYKAEVFLDDGTTQLLDLEEKGWADKELLKRVARWSLIPKPGAPQLPIVVVNIPKGSKPIFNSRVYGKIAVGANQGTPLIRVYRIGYRTGRVNHWTWVLPNGSIETGTDDDCWLAELTVRSMGVVLDNA